MDVGSKVTCEAVVINYLEAICRCRWPQRDEAHIRARFNAQFHGIGSTDGKKLGPSNIEIKAKQIIIGWRQAALSDPVHLRGGGDCRPRPPKMEYLTL